MTGGGDLDEGEHDILDESDDVADEDDDVDIDEDDGTGDGQADAPVSVNPQITDNDPDPTAGASDIGGRAASEDDDS